MTNLMRSITVAPGITVAAKDLTKMDNQFIAHHHLAGNAVLTHCTESKEGRPRREYWEIETCFHDGKVNLHYGCSEEFSDYQDWEVVDQALAALTVIGARWAEKHEAEAYAQVIQGMMR